MPFDLAAHLHDHIIEVGITQVKREVFPCSIQRNVIDDGGLQVRIARLPGEAVWVIGLITQFKVGGTADLHRITDHSLDITHLGRKRQAGEQVVEMATLPIDAYALAVIVGAHILVAQAAIDMSDRG